MIINVLGVGSCIREASYSTRPLNLILELIKTDVEQIHILELRKRKLPMLYTTATGNEIFEIAELIKKADAFVLATPDYHCSMSGSLKNFLNYFWSEFTGKTFGYIVGSHEKGLTVMEAVLRVVYAT